MFESLEEGARDIGRHSFQKHPWGARDLLTHAGGDLGDVESGREVVFCDRIGDIDGEPDVDQVVVRLLLICGRNPLSAATPEASDLDATGKGWHTSRTVSVG